MSKIIEALKNEGLHISYRGRWLMWEHGHWTVKSLERGQERTEIIYSGHDEPLAVAHLLYRE